MSENLGLNLTIKSGGLKEGVDDLDKVGKSGTKAEKSLHGVEKQTKATSSSLKALGAAALAYISIDLAKNILMTADRFNILQQRIKTATGSIEEYSKVSARLYSISQQTGTALESNVVLFQQLARAAVEVGATNEDVLKLTKTLQQLGTIGGSSADQMGNAMLQFGQAMAGGVMRAEEFNSIVENTPEIAVRIAEGLGMSVGQLRMAVLEGNVLSDQVFGSLLKQTGKVNEEFAKMPATLARASQNLDNSTSLIISRIDDMTNASGRLAQYLLDTSAYMDNIAGKARTVIDLDTEILRIRNRLATTEAQINDSALTNLYRLYTINKLENERNDLIRERQKLTRGDVGLDLEAEFKANTEREINALLDVAVAEQEYLDRRYNDTKTFRNKQIKAAEDASKAQLKIAKEQAEKERTLFEAMADAEEQAYQQKLAVAYARETIEFDNAKARQDYLSEIAKDEVEEQNEVIDKTREMIEAANEYGDAWTRTGNKAIDALNSMATVMGKVNKKDLEYKEQLADMRDKDLEGTKDFQKLEKARADNSVKGSMQMLAASVSMYEEGSDAQKAAHTAFMAFRAIELAMDIQKAISAATVAVATQGEGEPYSAWARIAAMSAMMGGLLSQIGASFGGAGGSSSASYDQVTQSDSGVLGGGDSNSIQNLSERLVDVNAGQYDELREINQNTKFLNEALTSATGALYSTGDITGLSADLSSAFKSSSFANSITSLGGDLFAGFNNSVTNAIFGGGSKTTSQGYGLTVGGTIGDVGTSGYQSMKKKTAGGLFGKSKTKRYDITSAVSPQVSKAISDTFSYVGDSLAEFGNLLDKNVSGMVDDLRVTTGKIDLTGKTSAEVQDALTNAINVQSDKWAYQLFNEVINQYQKLNESAFDTLSRLVIEKTVVEDVLKTTGQSVVGDALDLSQALISLAGGMSNLTDSAKSYYESFFSDQEQFDRLTEQLTGTLRNVNVALPDSRSGYKALVEGLNLTTDAGKRAYVALLGASDQADEYYSNLEDAQNGVIQERISLLNDESAALSNNINQLEALYNVLESTFNQLVGSTTSSAAQYMTAQTVLSSALESARGGNLPGVGDISGTLSTLASNQPGGYATLADFKRDQLTTAGMIDELMGYTDDQLTVEESMLNELARQTELLENIDVSTLTTGGVGSVSGIPLARPRPVTLASTQTNQPTTGDGVMRAMDRMWGELLNLRKDNQRQSEELVRYSRETSDTLDRWEAIGQPEVRA